MSKKNDSLKIKYILSQFPILVSQNMGFLIIYLHDKNRIIGIWKHTHSETNELGISGYIQLADVYGNIKSYDLADIEKLD